MDFISPTRTKRRRSLLYNDASVLDNVPGKIKDLKVKDYYSRLNNEKKKWKDYEKLLLNEYWRGKRSGESKVPVISDYLNSLPEEDKVYLQNMKEKKLEFEHVCEVILPDLVENVQLLSFEFEKQVKLRSLKNANAELLIRKCHEVVCKKNEDLEILVSPVEDSTNES